MRRHNSALVLGAIADAPGLSRADIAARTGLAKATVSSLIDRMISAGLVEDGGPQQRPGRGRPGTALSLSPTGPHGLGVEIGVDYVATCLVDLHGQVRRQRLRRADNRSSSRGTALARVARTVATGLREADRLGVAVGGIGIAVPGLVETASGVLRTAPNLGWQDLDLKTAIAEHLGGSDIPVVVGNEANFAALAELWCGGHHDVRDFVQVSGEIGIGAGIVIDGALFDGVRGFTGEIGHVPVDPDGPRCGCGARGCLERMAGQEWILRHAISYPATPDAAATGDQIAELVRRLEAGDATAVAALRTAARWLGVGLAALLNIVDVPAIVLGGTYAALAPWLREPMETELAARVVSAAWSPITILTSSLGTLAAVRGAAESAVRTIIADPDPFVTAWA